MDLAVVNTKIREYLYGLGIYEYELNHPIWINNYWILDVYLADSSHGLIFVDDQAEKVDAEKSYPNLT